MVRKERKSLKQVNLRNIILFIILILAVTFILYIVFYTEKKEGKLEKVPLSPGNAVIPLYYGGLEKRIDCKDKSCKDDGTCADCKDGKIFCLSNICKNKKK